MLIKYSTDADVTVIESTKIGIIGAGEGSTGTLPWFIRDKWPDGSIDEMEFLRKTKGTLKLGIRLQNWKGDGSYMYSPFHGSPTDTQSIDTTFFGSIIKYGRGDYSSLHSWLMDDKMTTYRKDFNGRFVPAFQNHSYHFDGVEVGKFFKEWCTKRGVKHIDSEVVDVQFDEREYLQSVKLSNGETIESNFWFDCSGFSRVLMGKTKNKWKSFKDHLITNTAIPFSTDVTSKTVKFETLAHALDAGWMWKIPLQHRNGCGYVFCDAFMNETKAVDELEKLLGHKVEPIKTIKFEAGRYEKVWYNNIAALGLSSHFLEPLQATSIHITIVSAANLIFHYLKGGPIYFEDREKYNGMVNNMIDDYADLLQMHYLTGRQDTPFWKYITNELKITDRNKYLRSLATHRLPTAFDVDPRHGAAGYPIWCHILDNSNCYDRGLMKEELTHFGKWQESINQMEHLEKQYKKIKPDLVSYEEFFKYLKI
jgi:tryptophan halogenase